MVFIELFNFSFFSVTGRGTDLDYHDTGCLGLVHWDDPEGWYREGGGRGFRMGNTCIPVADS